MQESYSYPLPLKQQTVVERLQLLDLTYQPRGVLDAYVSLMRGYVSGNALAASALPVEE